MTEDQKPKRRNRHSSGMARAIDRLPPHSVEAEQCVLGCILLDPSTALPLAVEIIGGKEDVFYDLRHQVIFDTMMALTDSGVPVNIVTLVERLRNANQLEPVGGPTYLSALPDVAPIASGVEYYARIVDDKATLRRMIQACTKSISRIYEEQNTDSEELIAEAEKDVLAVRNKRERKAQDIREIVFDAITDIERLHQSQGQIGGISTGLRELDRKTDGMHPGEMIVIAAYPGGGKTTLAVGIAERLAVEESMPVGIFSLEMKAKRLVMRMIASRSRINMRDVRDGKLNEGDFRSLTIAASKLANAPIHFCDLSDINISQLRARARQMKQRHGIGIVVVDYIQLIASVSTRRDATREQEVAGISRGIKHMAEELGIPVLALSQMNEDGKLRESRSIGQDADSVWILTPKEQGVNERIVDVTLKISKQRDGDAPAEVDLKFQKAYTRFESETVGQEEWQGTMNYATPYAE